jgi:hypothetical protein
MKKQFIMALACFIALIIASSTGARMNVIGLSNVGDGAASCPSGTYEIGYNGDHTSGADYACYESGTANEQGTTVDATVTSDYVSVPATNDYLRWTITGDISADIDSLGSIFFSTYITDDGDTLVEQGIVFELAYNGSNYIACTFHPGGGGQFYCYHNSAGTGNQVQTSDVVIDVDTWVRCGYTWNASLDKHALDCISSGSVTWDSNSGSPDDEDDPETIDGFDDTGAVDPDTFLIGELEVNWAIIDTPVLTKDVYIVSEYKATDPGSL